MYNNMYIGGTPGKLYESMSITEAQQQRVSLQGKENWTQDLSVLFDGKRRSLSPETRRLVRTSVKFATVDSSGLRHPSTSPKRQPPHHS